MADWKNRILGDVITLKRGYDLPQHKRETGDIPIFSSSGISGSHSMAMVEGPGVVTGRYGTIGEVFYSPGPFWPLNTTLYIEDFHGNDPRFIYYFMKCINWQQFLSASAVPGINRNTVHKLPVIIPDLVTQKRIASILQKIDEKIECNTEINDNLLQQTIAIFNDRYESAEEQRPFTSMIHVLGGGTPKTGEPEYWNGDIPFFTPKDVGNPYTFQTEKTITTKGLGHCNSRLYPQNTSFVTARGTVGKVSLAGKPMAMNQSCYALASDSIDPILVYFYTLRAVESLKHKASGAVFDAIVTRDFDTEVISVISEADSADMLSNIAPMMEAIHTNAEENTRLAALRDALLPRLMSGEIDVSAVRL